MLQKLLDSSKKLPILFLSLLMECISLEVELSENSLLLEKFFV